MSNEIVGHGTIFKLDPDGGSSYVEIANQVDGTLSLTADVIETTNKSGTQWKTFEYGNRGDAATFSGMLPIDNYVELNGTDEYFYVADNIALDLTTDVTIQANIRTDTVAAGEAILVHKHDSTDGYILRRDGDEIEMVIDNSGTTASTTITTDANLTAGKDYKIRAIYDGGTTSVKIYVNDVLKSVSTTGTIPATCGTNATRMTIGTDATASGSFFDGRIYKIIVADLGTDSTAVLAPADAVAFYMFEGNGDDETSNSLDLTGSGIAAGNYSDRTLITLRDAITNKTKVVIQLSEDGTSILHTGTYVITSLDRAAPQNDVVTYSISATLDGVLTIS